MTSNRENAFAFDDEFPLEPIARGTNVMVSGPAFGPAEDFARLMVTAGTDYDDGMLFISTNKTAKKFLGDCQRTRPNFDASRVGVIDCSGQEMLRLDSSAQIKYVSTQGDLTGIGMKFSALYQSIYEHLSHGGIRTGLISLSSLTMYVDFRKLFRFTQTLSSRIDSAGGLGVFLIDPTAHDDQTISTLQQAVDGEISVRETDGDADGEVRVRGLRDQPDGWQPFTLPATTDP